MSSLTKKFLVILPVVLLSIFYLHDHYDTYRNVGSRRLFFLALTFLVLYGWIFLEVVVRKQKTFFQIATQASFYIYIFMVLTLTGYFILFREASVHNWWDKMMARIDRKDHVNLELFKMFKIYKVFSRQIIGNFIMLLPLGIFLPLLYKRISNFFVVLVTSFLISTLIELLQLITSFRSTDVDDIFLNTLGASAGFIIYKLIALVARPASSTTPVLLSNG